MMGVPALASAVAVLQRRAPGATLVRNQMGNLAVMNGHLYLGWVDLLTGDVTLFDFLDDES